MANDRITDDFEAPKRHQHVGDDQRVVSAVWFRQAVAALGPNAGCPFCGEHGAERRIDTFRPGAGSAQRTVFPWTCKSCGKEWK